MACEARTERDGTYRRVQGDARRSDGACQRPGGAAGRRRASTRTRRADGKYARENEAHGDVGGGGRSTSNARTHRESLHLFSAGNSAHGDENRRATALGRKALERENGPALQRRPAACSTYRRVSR